MRLLATLLVSILLLSACGSEAELSGIDLPLAEAPENVEGSGWGLPFLAEFPSGFWEEGGHRYRFVIDCPVLGEKLESTSRDFQVSSLTPTLSDPVYIRLSGLSHDILQPTFSGSFSPTQDTIAAVTYMGISDEAVAEATDSCTGLIEFDGDQSAEMLPGKPFRP